VVWLAFLQPVDCAVRHGVPGVLGGRTRHGSTAWLDAPLGFLGLLLAYLTCEITRSPRRVLLYAAWLAVGAYSLLTKESAVLSCGLCALWLLGMLVVRERSWKTVALLILGGWLPWPQPFWYGAC